MHTYIHTYIQNPVKSYLTMGSRVGGAYVFRKLDNESWVEEAKLMASDGMYRSLFLHTCIDTYVHT